MRDLVKDPLNMIIIGVAGQGNVVTSHLVCNALVERGYVVTFGQLYMVNSRISRGLSQKASQRLYENRLQGV